MSLLQEKRARKLAEEDAQRLYNRIRQLQKASPSSCPNPPASD
jgi:hypothetical protein